MSDVEEKTRVEPNDIQVELPPTTTKWKFSNKSHVNDGDVALKLFNAAEDMNEPIDPEEERKLIRKVDFLILPLIAVNYAFFYIDKTTLSYAAIFGIREDLNLYGTRYSWLSALFYFGFLAWAFPTNFLMQRLPLGKYLGVNIFMWGFFLMLQAACNSFETLAVLRTLAGAAEACSDPSFMLITWYIDFCPTPITPTFLTDIFSMWYTRREQPIKIGIWYTANGVGIALGGLLGYGIGHIKGALASWRYEFIIIGAMCCIWGIVICILMPDSPVTAKFLTEREKRIAVERLKSNQTGIENKHLKVCPVFLITSTVLTRLGLPSQRGFPRHQIVPVLHPRHRLQHPQRRHLELWHHHHQRLRLQHARDNTDANPLRRVNCTLHSALRVPQQSLRKPSVSVYSAILVSEYCGSIWFAIC